ncbi:MULTISPECIES: hypothetical protein, partial [unclassified Bradyrhizobium]|uniref:hypothetical protein n=1 Tax=unclassified Bradyrhizobium TaxID=2631580 RepID=UPI002916C0AC
MAAMEPKRVLRDARTNGFVVDVKSQRADTPTLVSPRKARERVACMVARKPGAPGRLRISVKTIAQGRPGGGFNWSSQHSMRRLRWAFERNGQRG